MKLRAILLAGLLASSLTSCGTKNQTNTSGDSTYNAAQNGSVGQTDTTDRNEDDSMIDDATDMVEDAGHAVTDAADDVIQGADDVVDDAANAARNAANDVTGHR